MKALVIGADGAIGQSLVARLRRTGTPVVATTRHRDTVTGRNTDRVFLDLRDDPSNWTVPTDVSVAYLCAAVTSLQSCRDDPEATAAVNVTNTCALAEALTRRGAQVIFLSTSAVFDGTTPFQKSDAPTRPLNEYGRQKARAEELILSLGPAATPAATIVRLTKVWAPGAGILVDWDRTLRAGQPVHPFSDMVIAPLPVEFVTEALYQVGLRAMSGIVQVSGPEDVTYADVARYIARRGGAAEDLVQPRRVSDSDVVLEAVPKHTTLNDERLRSELGMTPPPVWETVESALS